MSRLPRWIIPALAILVLIAIAAPGNSSRQASAAPQAATTQPTRRSAQPTSTPLFPTDTPAPQSAPTEDTNAAQGPLVFGQAPSPDSGTLGIILDRTQSDAVIQSVVPGGPADKAGVQGGDVVTAVDGTAVSDSTALISAVTAKKTGDTVTLTVSRSGKNQDIQLTVASRREVYCPLPAPKVTAGTALISGSPRWSLEQFGTTGIKLSLTGSKMSFKPPDPGQRWQAGASIKLNSPNPTDYTFTIDITQTNQTVSGLLLNYDAEKQSAYLLQMQFNGSWFIQSINSDGSTSAGPSFSESSWKVPDAKNPGASATNTVSVSVQQSNWYLSLNGKFVCGLPFSQIVDPPLGPGQVGVFALVDKDPTGKFGVSYSKVTLNALPKSGSATQVATQAAGSSK